ncbi:MAG TPA: PEGA domain-containing protein, partial [Deltaproteobacteria bacterium]|nr:PEGA domain-containing protein [Deltaproteobacteria bacterium]
IYLIIKISRKIGLSAETCGYMQLLRTIYKRDSMNRRCIYFAVIMLVLTAAGCTAPDEYKWIPWYEFRGHCYLKLHISVESLPDEAEVFIDGVSKGTTPCSFVYESTRYIKGEKRKLPMPDGGSSFFETRETGFLGETEIEIKITKQGFKPVNKTLILEDYFLSDSLDHKKIYEKSLKLSYTLKKQ